MSKKNIGMLTFFIMIVAIFSFIKFRQQKSKVKVKCYYMAYACGDCQPQFKIKDVLFSEKIDRQKLINQEVQIKFKTKEFERRIDSLTGKCAICYDYYFEGQITYLPDSKDFQLDADTCILQLRKNCCE